MSSRRETGNRSADRDRRARERVPGDQHRGAATVARRLSAAAPGVSTADVAQLQRSIGNSAVTGLLGTARGVEAVQRKGKGGNKEGEFIGSSAAIHIHIGIGNPHLKLGGSGDRYDIKGTDWNGYSYRRCADALDALTQVDRSGISGGTDCRNWLEDVLEGETIPSIGMPGSAQGSRWGVGLINSYPARPFQKGQ